MNKPILYGIKNCDTVKRARAWLDEHGVAYDFHDYKAAGVPADRLAAWVKSQGWEVLVNRKGTTWRKLPEDVKASVVDAPSAISLMIDQASVIKRPVVEWSGGELTVGFDDAAFAAASAASD